MFHACYIPHPFYHLNYSLIVEITRRPREILIPSWWLMTYLHMGSWWAFTSMSPIRPHDVVLMHLHQGYSKYALEWLVLIWLSSVRTCSPSRGEWVRRRTFLDNSVLLDVRLCRQEVSSGHSSPARYCFEVRTSGRACCVLGLLCAGPANFKPQEISVNWRPDACPVSDRVVNIYTASFNIKFCLESAFVCSVWFSQ